MQKEQVWVEQLLKRMRNEADTQSESFHRYLVEQLLGVSSSILAAMKNQEKTVNTLSSKIDKTVSFHAEAKKWSCKLNSSRCCYGWFVQMETLNSRLDTFMADQDKLHKSHLQDESKMFQSIAQGTDQLRSSFKADRAAAEEYQKVGSCFWLRRVIWMSDTYHLRNAQPSISRQR